MPAVNSVLVVGGGAAGAATAILLAEAGVAVDLVEAKPEPTALGSGITLQGNALRVLRQLGVWEQVRAAGYAFDSLGLRAPDPAGTLLAEIPDARTGGPDLPATVGMPRPELARILLDRAAAAGAKVRFGATVAALAQDDRGVDVTFADRSAGRYDLVVGADGIRSHTRDMIGIDPGIAPVGHGHLARLRAPARERVPHRPLLRRPLLHRGLLPHRRELALRLHRRTRPGPVGAEPRERLATHARAVDGLPRPVGRHPRHARSTRTGSTTPGSKATSCPRRGTAAGSS